MKLPQNSAQSQRMSYLLIAVIALIHLAIAGQVPLGVDEAHYALYALHPALSYFDHPPLVGWLQMLIAPFGYSEFTVRLVPTLLFAMASIQVLHLTRQLFPAADERAPFVAVAILNLAPFLQLMGWGLVPDMPLMVVALAAIQVTYKLHKAPSLGLWLALGALYGLAGLSKYTAVFLPLGLIGFMCQYHGWRWILKPAPWLAALLALALISPVLIWNQANDWISFNYQTDRGLTVNAWQLKDAVVIQLAQAGLYSFLAYVGAIAATLALLRKRWQSDKDSAALLVWSAWPLLLVIGYSAGDGPVLPNWPAMAWTLLAPLSAVWIIEQWQQRWVRLLTYASTSLSLVVIGFVFLFFAFMPLKTMPFMAKALRDLNGWQQAAQHAATLKSEHFGPNSDAVLLVDNWTKASRIAWYAYPEQTQVLANRTTQFSIWFGQPSPQSRGILVRDKGAEANLDYPQFGLSCERIDSLETGIDGIAINQFQFYLCQAK
ncbi:ArnT family glycosyltransferase [Ferrimonas aestuarii]|uniref:Glycosyltransferase RgtA/B/C/D-like domain-containing protein n=1 Tax=Ferrimonas aestuarii TaxID=2569539 RepID=A0A4U1BT19_9GAMM|nr:glycosyltransferase family 39 protein [Ferrimonas aestuarii]TKB58289.1 hypothetical protein FCL42_00590 [Ferrimonas aestuarii]